MKCFTTTGPIRPRARDGGGSLRARRCRCPEKARSAGSVRYSATRSPEVIAAIECPAGRIVAIDKAGEAIEPEYEASICIIQDPEKKVSGGIFVKGNIPIESSEGHIYEVRNRVMLCRCGESKNKPYCDSSHIQAKFKDKQ
jgi:CDGSH-type Zn-finger protein